MVRKLLKYEIFAYARTLTPMYLILLGISVLCRLVQLFENDGVSYGIVFTSSVVALVITLIACIGMTAVFGVVRFYKNLYSAEGYLSFTLPVTPTAHLVSKTAAQLIFQAIAVAVCLLAGAVATLGEVLREVLLAADWLMGELFAACGHNAALYVIELLVLLAVGVAYAYLMCCTCITVGQTAKKNRILMAFGAYFVWYLITQVVGTVFLVVVALLSQAGLLDEITRLITRYPQQFLHVALIGATLLATAVSAVFFFVSHRIMSRRLNLE